MHRLANRGIPIYVTSDEDGRLEVYEQDNIRSLYFDSGACQSSLRLDNPAALVLGYTRSMLTALLFRPTLHRVLLIGLGGGALAHFLLKHFPSAVIDCVETRPSVVALAQQYFHLPVLPQLRIHLGDGAKFMRQQEESVFDMILVDAFEGTGIHPNVCVPQFYADCRRALKCGGVLSVNLWNTPEASCEPLLSTIQSGFSGQILRLPVEQRANLIALGLDKTHTYRNLTVLREPAQRLTETLGLDFLKQLRRLQHHNSVVLRRANSRNVESFNRTARR